MKHELPDEILNLIYKYIGIHPVAQIMKDDINSRKVLMCDYLRKKPIRFFDKYTKTVKELQISMNKKGLILDDHEIWMMSDACYRFDPDLIELVEQGVKISDAELRVEVSKIHIKNIVGFEIKDFMEENMNGWIYWKTNICIDIDKYYKMNGKTVFDTNKKYVYENEDEEFFKTTSFIEEIKYSEYYKKNHEPTRDFTWWYYIDARSQGMTPDEARKCCDDYYK